MEPWQRVFSVLEHALDQQLGNSQTYVQNLPVSLTPLIGREQELQAARARLSRPQVRLMTLTGTPGVGKTRLAMALGAELLEEFERGACFISLVPISDPDLVIPTIIHTLVRRPATGRSRPAVAAHI